MKKLPILLSLSLLVPVSLSQAQEWRYHEDPVTCLSRTLYGEANGAPVAFVASVGHTALTRARRLGKPLCAVIREGYAPKPVPMALQSTYQYLANGILTGQLADPTPGADSFNKGRPAFKARKLIGVQLGHSFYKAFEDKPSG